jgi:hypothetical protein
MRHPILDVLVNWMDFHLMPLELYKEMDGMFAAHVHSFPVLHFFT